MPLYYHVLPTDHIEGDLLIPGDKSISHRAVMLASIAEGDSLIKGFLPGADCLATLNAMQKMGVHADQIDATSLKIQGRGKYGLTPPESALDLGNSGTGLRLLCGLLAGLGFSLELTGDASLRKRPMSRVIDPLTQMGANITATVNGTSPLYIHPVTSLNGIEYRMPIASAQVKSALLLAGLYAKGETHIIENIQSRDHTEKLLQRLGVKITLQNNVIAMMGEQKLQAAEIDIPSDISSAAFFMVAASIAKRGRICLSNIGINTTRRGIINLLQKMGANIQLHDERFFGFEPVADIEILSSVLNGITINEIDVPSVIDELPVLLIAAATAKGQTILTGAKELRVKESDRLAVMVRGLRQLGVNIQELEDGVVIEGNAGKPFTGANIDCARDHRIAMAFTVASLASSEPIIISDCTDVVTSFPNFSLLACDCGIQMSVENKEIY